MTKKKVRVRFAPSPTGPLHVGGLRTALFNYLFAKKSGGKFLIRIEDTDKKREVAGAEKYILDSLKWCGVEADEEHFRQSERKGLYKKYILALLKKGWAYYAFDTEEELEKLRAEEEKKGKAFVYNWRNRSNLNNSIGIDENELKKKIQKKKKYVVRFKSPVETEVETFDIIRGESYIDASLLDDKILIKADGMPTYHFANIVDDYLTGVTHVIRGEEWLPSLALHTLLYKAFGWEVPLYAHLPLILNPSGKGKLSKRGAEKNGFPVFPLFWKGEKEVPGLKEAGVLPEAVVNYLSTLGWTPSDSKEILSLKELESLFTLEKVVSSPANFDFEKLKWYNHHHMQEYSDSRLLGLLLEIDKSLIGFERDKLKKAIGLVKERANTVNELTDLSSYLFAAPKIFDVKSVKKINRPGVKKILEIILTTASSADASKKQFVNTLKKNCEEKGFSTAQTMMTTRVVLVGKLSGIDLQEIVNFIGVVDVVERVKNALQHILKH